jgi:phosphatidylglycerophosphate synthase
MLNPKLWPNLLSGTRIALMPAVLMAAIMGSKLWFLVLVAASLFTDALDGFLARRLNAFSDFGRKLDSVADYLTMLIGIAGIALLWPEIMQRELLWVVTGLAAFLAVVVFGIVRLGRVPCYHTWATKVGVIGCAFSMIPLLADWSPVPFRAMIVLQIFAGIEEMIITVLLPAHTGEIATLWHAVRQRRANRALLQRTRQEVATSAGVK